VERIPVAPVAANTPRNFGAKYLIALILSSLGIGLAGIRVTHFVTPMPGYWLDAQEFAKTSRIADTFTPDFYPALLGEGMRLFGKSGPALVQLLMYVVFAVMAYCIFRLLDISDRYAALFAGLVSLCPDLIAGINRIWDVEASCTAFAALACCILLIAKKQASFGKTILTGIVWGTGIALRPNFPLLALPIAYAVWASLPRNRMMYAKLALHLSLVAAIAFGTVASLNRFSHGAIFWPRNGPYNFYAGANEFTGDSLKSSHLNGEESISPALAKMGIVKTGNELFDARLNKLYMDSGIAFIRSHPLEWSFDFGALKLFTMLRPDTKIHPLFSPEGLARALVSSASIVWLVLLYFRIRSEWKRSDSVAVLLVVSYSLPFLLTNSDPRFGIALNLFLWIAVISFLCPAKWRKPSSRRT